MKYDLSEHAYLLDHIVNGRVLLAGTVYLVMAWQALAQQLGVDYEQLPVTIRDFNIHKASVLPQTGTFIVHYNYV